MSTSNVNVIRSGSGWTVDVTACDLLPDLTIKDFVAIHSDVVANLGNYAKTSKTTLTYSGPALATGTAVEIRRRTPTNQVTPIVTFPTKFSSAVWNAEFDRIVRRAEEMELNGVGPGSAVTSVLPKNDAYSSQWSGDTVYPPTRSTLYDKFESMAPKENPTFTGSVILPAVVAGDNTSKAASTSWVQSELGSYAPLVSPAFTGSPTAPTQVTSNSSTRLANTAFVNAFVANDKTTSNTWTAGNTFEGSLSSFRTSSNTASNHFQFRTTYVNCPGGGVVTTVRNQDLPYFWFVRDWTAGGVACGLFDPAAGIITIANNMTNMTFVRGGLTAFNVQNNNAGARNLAVGYMGVTQ